MSEQTRLDRPARTVAGSASRKRRWWRWVLASVITLAGLVVAAAVLFIKLQPAPSPLALPAGPVSAPAGPLDGTWRVAAGSEAGFRVPETALGFSNDVVGRTGTLNGAVAVSGGAVTHATVRIDLTTVKVGGKTRSQFAKSLGAGDHPDATVTLTRPVTLGPAFASGATMTRKVPGRLTMHGVSRPVTITVTGRRDGPAIETVGSIPVAFSRWEIQGPGGLGFLGSLADHGIAEFRLILRYGGAA